MAIRIIHIGVGLRGGHWLEFVKDHQDTETVAVVDINETALSNAKGVVGSNACEYFKKLPEALKSVKADAVIIASPSSLHAEHARHALGAGLAVMVEKPFTTTVADAYSLINYSEETGRTLMVAENFRFVPVERTVRKLMDENLLGDVHTVTLIDRRRQPASTQGPWVAEMEYAQLNEIAIHHFDSVRSFFRKKPLGISIHVYNPKGSDYKHGACTEALIEMEDGINIQYLGTLTSYRYSYSLRIEGERGELWTNRKYIFFRKKGSRFFMPLKKETVPAGDGKPYPREGTTSLLNSLRDAIVHNKIPETHCKDNIWNVAMVQASILSDKERRTVEINEVMTDSDGKSISLQ